MTLAAQGARKPVLEKVPGIAFRQSPDEMRRGTVLEL